MAGDCVSGALCGTSGSRMAVAAAGSPSGCLYRPRPDPRSFGMGDRSRYGRGGRLSGPPYESPLRHGPFEGAESAHRRFSWLALVAGDQRHKSWLLHRPGSGESGVLENPDSQASCCPAKSQEHQSVRYYRRALMRLGRPRFVLVPSFRLSHAAVDGLAGPPCRDAWGPVELQRTIMTVSAGRR